jgi:type I restriction enzyme R subunit
MLTPEQKARQTIDQQLVAAGWVLQDRDQLNRLAAPGVAVREFPTASGPADYALLVDGKLVGVVEAKKEGTSLTAVAEQTARYLTSATKYVPRVGEELPFGYEANGHEIRFLDRRDPEPRSRPVFWFHRPETLRGWARQTATLWARLQHFPVLQPTGLRNCQVEAIRNLEVSLKHDRPRALIQMATGAGKTFTAVTAAYRLIKLAGAKRVLFLLHRAFTGRLVPQDAADEPAGELLARLQSAPPDPAKAKASRTKAAAAPVAGEAREGKRRGRPRKMEAVAEVVEAPLPAGTQTSLGF